MSDTGVECVETDLTVVDAAADAGRRTAAEEPPGPPRSRDPVAEKAAGLSQEAAGLSQEAAGLSQRSRRAAAESRRRP